MFFPIGTPFRFNTLEQIGRLEAVGKQTGKMLSSRISDSIRSQGVYPEVRSPLRSPKHADR